MNSSATCRELYGYCVLYVGDTVQVSGNSGGCAFTWLALHYLIPIFSILLVLRPFSVHVCYVQIAWLAHFCQFS